MLDKATLAVTAFLAVSGQAIGGGLDASGQSVAFLFREGSVLELGFGTVSPGISGRDAAFLGGSPTGDIAGDFELPSLSFRHDLTARLAIGVRLERPFHGEVMFGPSSAAFGDTRAEARTTSLTALLRYDMTERFSVFGGVRAQRARAEFALNGAIYGPLAGYTADLDRDIAAGYVLGVAYEIPDYALRATIAFASEVEHDFATTERLGSTIVRSEVSATTPRSVNLEIVSGVAPGTFVFGGARWAEWSVLQIAPPLLAAASPDPLVDFNDTVTYTLGIGRQFSDAWIGTAALIYEPSTDARTTPLTPTDGLRGVALGAIHRQGGREVHVTLSHTEFGDATPFVAALGRTVSSFTGNASTAVSVRLVQRF